MDTAIYKYDVALPRFRDSDQLIYEALVMYDCSYRWEFFNKYRNNTLRALVILYIFVISTSTWVSLAVLKLPCTEQRAVLRRTISRLTIRSFDAKI